MVQFYDLDRSARDSFGPPRPESFPQCGKPRIRGPTANSTACAMAMPLWSQADAWRSRGATKQPGGVPEYPRWFRKSLCPALLRYTLGYPRLVVRPAYQAGQRRIIGNLCGLPRFAGLFESIAKRLQKSACLPELPIEIVRHCMRDRAFRLAFGFHTQDGVQRIGGCRR